MNPYTGLTSTTLPSWPTRCFLGEAEFRDNSGELLRLSHQAEDRERDERPAEQEQPEVVTGSDERGAYPSKWPPAGVILNTLPCSILSPAAGSGGKWPIVLY